jgi:signal recognition particle receptor subunit beta
MLINQQRGEISFKIVYYGAGGGGKTTNVEFIHDHINPQLRGELVSVKTEGDRTLFFDFLYVELTSINGLKPKFNFYTVPGQPIYTASRRLVLRGVDGVVFVADSQEDRLQENIESLTEVQEYLKEKGNSLSEFPFVLQCNKQDLFSATAPEELSKQLGLNGQPRFGAIAIQGKSVFDTMRAIITLVTQRKM